MLCLEGSDPPSETSSFMKPQSPRFSPSSHVREPSLPAVYASIFSLLVQVLSPRMCGRSALSWVPAPPFVGYKNEKTKNNHKSYLHTEPENQGGTTMGIKCAAKTIQYALGLNLVQG